MSPKLTLLQAQLETLKFFVTALHTGAQQCQLGPQGKIAFAGLDAIVEEVVRLCGDTTVDATLVTGSTIDQETMQKVANGNLEQAVTELGHSTEQTTQALKEALEAYGRSVGQSVQQSQSDTVGAAEVAAISKAAMAHALYEQIDALDNLVGAPIETVLALRIANLAEVLKSRQS